MQENLEPIYNRCTTVSSAMKVCHLKAILEDLPDDMPVVIPDRVDENYNMSSQYEVTKVLCLNAIASRADTIAGQINDTMECEQVLF